MDFATLEAASDKVASQAAAGMAPSIVRETLLGLGADHQFGNLHVHPWTLGIALLLEEIEHPELTGGTPKLRDNAAAAFIFCEPEAAAAALRESRAAFDQAAFTFSLEKVPVGALKDLLASIRTQILRGRRAMPGQYAGEPGAEGGDNDPLAPSQPETAGSAGT